jgi:hypothetical protein
MTALDREQFSALTLRQAKLEEALAQVRAEFREFELRLELPEAPAEQVAETPRPLVVGEEPSRTEPPPLPPLPVIPSLTEEPAVPVAP